MKNERDLPRTRDTSCAFMTRMHSFAPCGLPVIPFQILFRMINRYITRSIFFIFTCRCLSFLYRNTSVFLRVAHDPFLSPGRYVTDKGNRNIDVSPTQIYKRDNGDNAMKTLDSRAKLFEYNEILSCIIC